LVNLDEYDIADKICELTLEGTAIGEAGRFERGVQKSGDDVDFFGSRGVATVPGSTGIRHARQS